MPVGYAVPRNVAASLSSIATAIAAKPGITAAVDSDTVEGDNLTQQVKVTGATVRQIGDAIRQDQRSVNVGAASAGTWTLTIDGETTTAIAFNATAAAVKSAIDALANAPEVTVTGVGSAADPWVIVFAELKDYVITGVGSGLTGGAFSITSPVANVHMVLGSTIV